MATRQGGVVSAAQLAALGVDRRAVSRRVAAGRLRRMHRAVYSVGHDHLGAWGRYRADFLWPEAKLIVEADGRHVHRDRFEEDRARDLALAALGHLTLRVTKRALTVETADRIRAVLSERLP